VRRASVQLGRDNELAECLAPYQHRRIIANLDAGRHIEADMLKALTSPTCTDWSLIFKKDASSVASDVVSYSR